MTPYISLEAVHQYSPLVSVTGLNSFKCEDGNWIACGPSVETPETQILNAINQGAKSICLMLKETDTGEEYPMEFDVTELLRDEYSNMQNKAMARKLRAGQAIDVSGNLKTEEGYYILDDFFDEKDYCNSQTEEWIWSIGISYQTGQVHASDASVFYQNENYECLYLR